jgi:glycosyltransferase involved in cell wall biosynthesis
MRPRLVFACRALQFPAITGGQLRTQRLLLGLSEAFEITIMTFEHHPASDEGHTPESEIRREFPAADVVMVPGSGSHKRVLQLRSSLGRRSWDHGRHVSRAFRAALEREVERTGAALLHFDDVGTALNGPVPGPVNVVAPHDVQYRIAGEIAARGTGFRRLFAEVEHRKLRREEPALWRRMDACVASSEVEQRVMAAAGARRVLMAPNGTDPVAPVPLTARRAEEPLRVLFVGTGGFQPNEHGLAWFVDEVAPRLRARVRFRFDVVGSPPNRPRTAPEVVYHGRVPDLDAHYAAADVAIVPVHFGGGSRLKTVEAMAYGVPLVSTRLGAEGLPVRPGEHYLEAQDPESFARAIDTLGRRLVEPDAGTAKMVADARAVAETLFWPRIAERLVKDYRAIADSKANGADRRRSARQRR